LGEPLEKFSIESEKNNIKYITPMIGETINYNDNMSTSKWWKDIPEFDSYRRVKTLEPLFCKG